MTKFSNLYPLVGGRWSTGGEAAREARVTWPCPHPQTRQWERLGHQASRTTKSMNSA